jgi:hypothetical protein
MRRCTVLLVLAITLTACGPPTAPDDEGPEETTDTTADVVAGLIDEYGLGDLECEEVEPYEEATAAVWCDQAGTDYELLRFENQSGLRRAFATYADGVGDEPRTWRQETDAGPRGGSVLTYVDDEFGATIVWTQEASSVLGFAWREDDRDLAALVEWWTSDGSEILGAEPDRSDESEGESEETEGETEETEAAPDNPLAHIAAGDCVRFTDTDMLAVDCGDPAAEAEVLLAADAEEACGTSSDRTYSVSTISPAGDTESFFFCLATLADPATDQVLEVGSCLEMIETGEGSATVTELPCDDGLVTHQVDAAASDADTGCDGLTETWIEMTEEEQRRLADETLSHWCVGER